MAIYGQDLYGKSYYGVDSTISYSLGPVTAVQTGYGEITLRWVTPANSNWSALRLVRNTAGFPADQDDGDVILSVTAGQAQSVYTDSGLTGGRYYYYTWFLASAFPAYSATTTYQPGDTVSSGGSNWVCLAANTLNITPAAGVTWAATNETALWNRGGQAMSLAVADYGYRDRLSQLLPTPYSTSQQEISSPPDGSGQLSRYLSVLAWGLDMARTALGEQEHLHRVATMPLDRMEHLAAELGVPPEASIAPRLRRYRVGNAAQLARRKGTLDSLRDVIYATTGYEADFTESPNRLLDADQAEFRYPLFPAWDPSVTYAPGDVVSYNGFLYSAVPSTVRIEAENTTVTLNGAPSYTVAGNSSGVTYSNNQKVRVNSNAIGQGATLSFTIPTSGTYDLAIAMTRSYDYGEVEFAVDGTRIMSGRSTFSFPPTPLPLIFDGYAPSPTAGTSVYLGSFTFLSGTHTIKITVDDKNPQSGTSSNSQNNGYQFAADYLTYTPTTAGHITGITPSGTATSNAFWTYYTAVPTHTLDNPLTAGVSTWEQVSFTTGANASNSSLAEYTGYVHLDGTGDHTGNLGVMTNSTGVTATLGVHSIPHAAISTWQLTTSYPIGSYVSYAGTNYLAILPSEGIQPDSDLTHWRPETISTTGTDRFLVSSYGLPLKHTAIWSPATTYQVGDLVEYQTQRYIASRTSQGSAPTGAPTDTPSWAWVDSAQDAYIASAWTSLYGGTTTATRSMYIEWYDGMGNLITTINPTPNTKPDILATFSRNTPNVGADAYASEEVNGGWNYAGSPSDLVAASSGMAYWTARTGTARYLTTDYQTGDINAGLTFVTAPPSGIEQGLTFRYTDFDNHWSVSRTRLTKMVSETVTEVATWSSLPDGSRIYVTLQGSAIAVYAYQGPGLAPVQLASVTDSTWSTAHRYGIFERSL